MESPNFLYEQFVSSSSLNSAMAEIQTSIQELASNEVFFNPGLISPSSITFSFNGSLQVGVSAPSPFKCLFGTGLIAGAHGLANGVDSPNYTVDFTSLIPGSGSVTAYIVASSGSVLQNPTTIIGAPSGHPDFSATFNPYLGYTIEQFSLAITATTTAPDNIVNIELGRTTLQSGQTSITSITTTNQVVASLIVPPASVVLSGDVNGIYNNNVVTGLQGRPVTSTAPTVNQVLAWNGAAWIPSSTVIPTTLPPSGPAGNDLSGNYPNPIVARSSASLFGVVNQMEVGGLTNFLSNIIVYDGISCLSQIAGAYGNIVGQCIMLGQLYGAMNTNNGTLVLPILNNNTQTLVNFMIQWGNYNVSAVGSYSIPLSPAFTNTCLWAGLSFSAVGSNGHNASLTSLTNSAINFEWIHYSSGNDTGSIQWLSVGF